MATSRITVRITVEGDLADGDLGVELAVPAGDGDPGGDGHREAGEIGIGDHPLGNPGHGGSLSSD